MSITLLWLIFKLTKFPQYSNPFKLFMFELEMSRLVISFNSPLVRLLSSLLPNCMFIALFKFSSGISTISSSSE